MTTLRKLKPVTPPFGGADGAEARSRSAAVRPGARGSRRPVAEHDAYERLYEQGSDRLTEAAPVTLSLSRERRCKHAAWVLAPIPPGRALCRATRWRVRPGT